MTRARNTASDWHHRQLDTSRPVYDRHDPRHHGIVVAVFNSSIVRIQWRDTGWKSDVPWNRVANVPWGEE